MTEQDKNNLKDGQEERELWPGRYYVKAAVDEWSHRGGIYEDVYLNLFQSQMPEEEAKALLEPLGFTSEMEDYLYIVSQAEQTFTEQQADELIAYLEAHKGTDAWKEPAEKPVENGIGFGAIPVGGPQDCYMLYKEDGYNLSFRAEAYYDVRGAEYLGRSRSALDGLKEQIDINTRHMSQEELERLIAYLEEKRDFDRQALIRDINHTLGVMSVEQLKEVKAYIDKKDIAF